MIFGPNAATEPLIVATTSFAGELARAALVLQARLQPVLLIYLGGQGVRITRPVEFRPMADEPQAEQLSRYFSKMARKGGKLRAEHLTPSSSDK